MTTIDPTEAELLTWLESLSNWGRWGPDDDLGTLHYLGSQQRATAAGLARGEGTVSLALPVPTQPVEAGDTLSPDARGPFWETAGRLVLQDGAAAPDPGVRHSAYDAFLIAPHGTNMTHLDAPSHTVFQGTIFNGHDASSSFSTTHAGSISRVREGIFGRGILLDIPAVRGVEYLEPGVAVYPEDLDRCLADAGIETAEGDIVFIRTGYRRYAPDGPTVRFAPRPGLQASCLPWLHEHRVSVIGSDVAIDVIPHGYEVGLPIHTIGMWAMGLWLVDNCRLEELSAFCQGVGRWEFACALAPLALTEGTGSPVNPMAIF